MGKSGYRKFMKKERAKVKLKGKKTLLPKGQNETDTNFKVKKIVIRDQIKQHAPEEVLTKKKLNTSELLSRLNHHNINMKQDAIEGLKEIVVHYSETLLATEAPQIINEASKLILDGCSGVRKEANNLLNEILAKVKTKHLSPLFGSLSSYLMCGLTHIDENIRRDSLILLDTLLKHTPSLCAQQHHVFLPVFLDLLSSPGESMTLSLNLDSRLTSIKWRAQVLTRIRTLLSALHCSSQENLQTWSDGLEKWKCHTVVVDTDENIYVPLPSHRDLCVANFTLKLNNSTETKTSEFGIKDFAKLLVPLLLDAFTEAVPNKGKHEPRESEYVITLDVAALLQCIVEIILLLMVTLKRGNQVDGTKPTVIQDFRNIIVSRLFENKFPYSTRKLEGKRNKRKREYMSIISTFGVEDLSTNCYQLNLSLAKLAISLGHRWATRTVVSYIKKCLSSPEKFSEEEGTLLESCLLELTTQEDMTEALSLLSVTAELSVSSTTPLSNHLFGFLSTVALDHKLTKLHRVEQFENWLASLPKYLLKKSISVDYLNVICQIAVRGYFSFSESLDSYVEAILDNIPKIEFKGLGKEEGDIKIANLLYWVKDWDEELVEGLAKGIENVYWGPRVTKYIGQILLLKSELTQNSEFNCLLRSTSWWQNNVLVDA